MIKRMGNQDEPPSNIIGRVVSTIGFYLGLYHHIVLSIYCATKGGYGIPIWSHGNGVESLRDSRGGCE